MSPRRIEDWADFKYAPGTRIAHVFPFGVDKPLCDGSIDGSGWHGTGSWEEYEHAKLLPLCPRCVPRSPHDVPYTEWTAPSPLYAHVEAQD